MKNRRDFIKASMLAAAGGGMIPNLFANQANGTPTRFIFMHRGNGLFPKVMVPPSLSEEDLAREEKKEPLEIDLDGHDLPDWMSPLEAHKENLTILQGLSGKMCTTGHHSWCSALGVYKANERPSSIKWATVDFELAKMFPSPMEHIELACFPTGGGNARGSLDGIAKGFSARGPQQPNYAFGSPKGAMGELFKSVSNNKEDQIKYQLERRLLAFAAENEARLGKNLSGAEQRKVTNYADSINAIRKRNGKVDAMGDVLRQHVPQLAEEYLADDLNTLNRQRAHAEVLLSALVSGLTNVVAFTVDELGHPYTGIPGIENEKVNMHDVGHNKSYGGVEAPEIRNRARNHHMTLVDTIVSRLKDVPEGDGTMFDNTMLFYFPDGGETHHSHGWEFPFVVMSGRNTKLKNLGRRYVRLPYHGQENHKTLGNWWTTILNAHGNPVEHFGDFDLSLKLDQSGPIPQFLA
ncbi:MAG: hypothetical protein ACI8UO_003412 [Verrucomicrobiales bacterium]|jgi:hypothetical protein